jgi:hypothetical protein
MDRMHPIGNERPPWTGEFSLEANTLRPSRKALFRKILESSRIKRPKSLLWDELQANMITHVKAFYTLNETGWHTGVSVYVCPCTALLG